MKKYISISNIIFALLLVSCEGVFVPDPIDPRLPKYTESGNNVAGALINSEVWKSVVSYSFPKIAGEPDIILYENKDSIRILFEGQSHVYNYIEFRLSGLHIHQFEDLIQLKDVKIPLDGLKNSAVCLPYKNYSNDLGSEFMTHQTRVAGQLYIRNVTMNDSLTSAVLSGTFGFTFNDLNKDSNEVSYGRFDFRFTEGTNFKIE